MALFGSPNAFIGLDIGTSSLKLVELVDRKSRVEVATYAQANLPNILLDPQEDENEAVHAVVKIVSDMMERSRVASDIVVAALPSSIIFSTVLTLPEMSDDDLDKAVHFAARDVVPADLDEMVLGWSRVGHLPRMDTAVAAAPAALPNIPDPAVSAVGRVPIFLTAAPQKVVARYLKLVELLKVQLYALEVETLPLARALLGPANEGALIVDIGDLASTFHIIEGGTPRLSYTLEYGGAQITARLAQVLGIDLRQAEEEKVRWGLAADGPAKIQAIILAAMESLMGKAQELTDQYRTRYQSAVRRTVLIGGGALMRGLAEAWSKKVSQPAVVGDPWRGLSYPQELAGRLAALGPTYAVAIGLAMRGTTKVQ